MESRGEACWEGLLCPIALSGDASHPASLQCFPYGWYDDLYETRRIASFCCGGKQCKVVTPLPQISPDFLKQHQQLSADAMQTAHGPVGVLTAVLLCRNTGKALLPGENRVLGFLRACRW